MYNKEKGNKKFISNEKRAKRREENNKKKKRELDTIYNMCEFISNKLRDDLYSIRDENTKVSKYVNNAKLDEYLKENGADDELIKSIRPFRFLVAELFTTYHLGFIKSIYRYDVRVLYIRERLDSMFGRRFSDDIDKIIDTLIIFSEYKKLYADTSTEVESYDMVSNEEPMEVDNNEVTKDA